MLNIICVILLVYVGLGLGFVAWVDNNCMDERFIRPCSYLYVNGIGMTVLAWPLLLFLMFKK